MYDNNQVLNVLSLLQESHRTHLLIKNTPEGVVKFLQWYCVFLLGKERNIQYFLNIQEGVDMSVYLSPVLESYQN
jgi:hypothetical protein